MVEQEIDYSPVIEILEDILGDYKLHNDYKGQISFDCPVCSYEIKGLDVGDGKGNLEVNYKHNVYKCWSCSDTHDTHGSLYKLIKKYGTTKQLKKYQLLKPDDREDQPKKIYKKVKLPKEFIPFSNVSNGIKLLPQYKQAIGYIKKRNITNDMILKYNIGFCYSGLYENRIIIPSYDENNELNYFIARSFLTKTKVKYKNPDVQKENIIWNENSIRWDEPLYIVEGVFDSIFLPNSIPLLGKHMSDYLFSKLYHTAKKLIIVLDGDAWDNAEKLYHKMNCGKLMGKVWIIKLPVDKDIADLQGNLDEFELKQID
jgi:DNA primase